MSDRPPKPEPRACQECGAPAYVAWQTTQGYWSRRTRCSNCYNARQQHNMTRPQYEEMLAAGCSVEGCDRVAVVIDHDHSICPQQGHSCDKCRRGPLCHYHNVYVIAKIDALHAGELLPELEYLGLTVTFGGAA